MRISDILEYKSEGDESDFPIKGHNKNDKDAILFINLELYEEGENLKVKKIIEKEEGCYKSCRFFDGQDARDEGFRCWIDFLPLKQYKKGLGKYTNYKVILERFENN